MTEKQLQEQYATKEKENQLQLSIENKKKELELIHSENVKLLDQKLINLETEWKQATASTAELHANKIKNNSILHETMLTNINKERMQEQLEIQEKNQQLQLLTEKNQKALELNHLENIKRIKKKMNTNHLQEKDDLMKELTLLHASKYQLEKMDAIEEAVHLAIDKTTNALELEHRDRLLQLHLKSKQDEEILMTQMEQTKQDVQEQHATEMNHLQSKHDYNMNELSEEHSLEIDIHEKQMNEVIDYGK